MLIDLLFQPIRPTAANAVEALADALHLVALHRQHHVGRRLVAADELELHPEQASERLRIDAGARARADVAHDQFVLEEVLDVLHPRGVVGDADVGFARRRTEPGHLGWIKARTRLVRDRCERSVAADQRKHAAVFRRAFVDGRGSDQAAGRGHILRHDGRVTGDVLAHVAGNGTPPNVVTAADAEADQQPVLALFGRLRRHRR